MESKVNIESKKDSATTGEVVMSPSEIVKLLVEQNKKTLVLLEKQQAENGILLKKLREQKTPQWYQYMWYAKHRSSGETDLIFMIKKKKLLTNL